MEKHGICPIITRLVKPENLELLEYGTLRLACLRMAERKLAESVAIQDGYDLFEHNCRLECARKRKLENREIAAAGSLAKMFFLK